MNTDNQRIYQALEQEYINILNKLNIAVYGHFLDQERCKSLQLTTKSKKYSNIFKFQIPPYQITDLLHVHAYICYQIADYIEFWCQEYREPDQVRRINEIIVMMKNPNIYSQKCLSHNIEISLQSFDDRYCVEKYIELGQCQLCFYEQFTVQEYNNLVNYNNEIKQQTHIQLDPYPMQTESQKNEDQ